MNLKNHLVLSTVIVSLFASTSYADSVRPDEPDSLSSLSSRDPQLWSDKITTPMTLPVGLAMTVVMQEKRNVRTQVLEGEASVQVRRGPTKHLSLAEMQRARNTRTGSREVGQHRKPVCAPRSADTHEAVPYDLNESLSFVVESRVDESWDSFETPDTPQVPGLSLEKVGDVQRARDERTGTRNAVTTTTFESIIDDYRGLWARRLIRWRRSFVIKKKARRWLAIKTWRAARRSAQRDYSAPTPQFARYGVSVSTQAARSSEDGSADCEEPAPRKSIVELQNERNRRQGAVEVESSASERVGGRSPVTLRRKLIELTGLQAARDERTGTKNPVTMRKYKAFIKDHVLVNSGCRFGVRSRGKRPVIEKQNETTSGKEVRSASE